MNHLLNCLSDYLSFWSVQLVFQFCLLLCITHSLIRHPSWGASSSPPISSITLLFDLNLSLVFDQDLPPISRVEAPHLHVKKVKIMQKWYNWQFYILFVSDMKRGVEEKQLPSFSLSLTNYHLHYSQVFFSPSRVSDVQLCWRTSNLLSRCRRNMRSRAKLAGIEFGSKCF